MSDSEEDATSISKQKSIFSGMTRVKQINHLREKWSPKPKASPDRSDSSSPSWRRPSSAEKLSTGVRRDSSRSIQRTQSVSGSPKRQSVLSVVDLERYLAINSWLEQSGIDVSQINVDRDVGGSPKGKGPLDEMYSSLEMMETAVESELGRLETATKANISEKQLADISANTSSPPLFDYLTVIGVDVVDVAIRNYWNQRENVYEATVVFAHPPESQFNAECLEHFCFPSGVKVASLGAKHDNGEVPAGGHSSREGDFFVLMLSGGGFQGQSVQYAMCMKGVINLRDSRGDMAIPVCYCIIAQFPFISFFRGVLQGFLDSLRCELESSDFGAMSSIVTNKHAGHIDDILHRIKDYPLPDKGCSEFIAVFSPPNAELTLSRPHERKEADEKSVLLLQWSLPLMFEHLTINRILQLLGFLLVEMKVIVVSDEIPLLSSTTLGLASLLHPLTWAGPVISVLPPFMHEYMEAPVPLICGVDELPHNFDCSKGTCILYLEDNRIQLHPEDERAFGKLEMPGWSSLSSDVTRFTTEMLERVDSSSRDKMLPLSINLVIHRMRRHIEDLVCHCAGPAENQVGEKCLSQTEIHFINGVMQTQMYQKYRDDQPLAAPTDENNPTVVTTSILKNDTPTTTASGPQTQDGFKEAASVLFQIALAGISLYPQPGSQIAGSDEVVVSAGTLSRDAELLLTIDEPLEIDHFGATLPSANSNPTPTPTLIPSPTHSARLALSKNNSPTELAVVPLEMLTSAQAESPLLSVKRRNRAHVWALSPSGLDSPWLSEDSSFASPNGSNVSRTMQHSPQNDFDSPRRSTNNDSEFGDGVKSVARSEHENLSYAPRGDTETTISLFDVALNDIPGSAEADNMWILELSDESLSYVHHDHNSDDECTSPLEDSEIVGDDLPAQEMAAAEIAVVTQNQLSCPNTPQSQSRSVDYTTDGQVESHAPQSNARLAPEQAKTLLTGINVDSRGAWDGWCEGKLFISTDCRALIWERRGAAFAALNMDIADITGITLEDSRIVAPGRHEERRIQIQFSSEAIHFQFLTSPAHDDFFCALKEFVRPIPVQVVERNERFVAAPIPSPTRRGQQQHPFDEQNERSPDDTMPPTIQKETYIDQFKARLQRGFLVVKHGRLGKPHTKLIFTDALCSYIIWRKPPPEDSADHQKLVDDDLQHRAGLFSHSKGIPIEKITGIVTGKQTSVFRRSVANKTDDRLCLSILTPSRTLDICAYSQNEFQELYRGLSLVLEEMNRVRYTFD